MLHLTLWIFLAGQTILVTAIDCPSRCNCFWVLDSLNADCSNLDLIDVPNFAGLPIEVLNLSNNHFKTFPTEVSLIDTLISLDLSNNAIRTLPPDTLLGYRNLRRLYLANNKISRWIDISPNQVLVNAGNLETLSLAGNPLKAFSSNSQEFVLISSSLRTLDLSSCNISKVAGNLALQALDKLETLILSDNDLQTISRIESLTLTKLDLSGCDIRFLQRNFFDGLPNLLELDLSRNSMISLEPQGYEYAISRSLRRINLSNCTMSAIYLQGFPNLTTALLQHNMIREVSEDSFRLNQQIEQLDLSSNVITVLHLNAFSRLRILKRLDLSYNSIAIVDRNTFVNNEILTYLNLSRNFLTRFSRIFGTSIITLDLSSCEITTVDADALVGIPITQLYLSRNLISILPEGMSSPTIQSLDLSLNRLSSINNQTFRHMPELSTLNLSGNRFTTPFRTDFFRRNQYLHQINIEDNPWRCDCNDKSFKDFFLYLTQTPLKVPSTRFLKCNSPENVSGRTWDATCFTTWFPKHNMSTIEKFWAFAMSLVAALCLGIFAYRMAKKYIYKKKQRRNASELRENIDDQRRIELYNRQIMQQEAQQNAPDPHETNPPSYEVALLMPPLKRLTQSYVDISVKESNERLDRSVRPSMKRNRSNRYHSDDTLLRNDDEDKTANIRRTPSFRRHAPRSRRGSRLVAVRPPRCPDPNMKASESLGKMSNFHSFDNSPYAKRKPRSTTTSSISPASSVDDMHGEGPSSVPLRNNSLDFVENYYVRPKSISNSNSGEEYEILSSQSDGHESRRTSIRSSIESTDMGIVIVHKDSPVKGEKNPKSSHESSKEKESNASRELRESQL